MPGVGLVFPYVRTRARNEILFPPLGIAALASQLRLRGIETHVYDCTFRDLAWLRGELERTRPSVVGISAMVSLSAATAEVAAMVRRLLPDSLLVAGGPLPSVFPRRFTPLVDAVFRGEADLSFPTFCAEYLQRGATRTALSNLDLGSYAGLVIDAAGLRVDNPPMHHSEAELAAFPPPDRSDFDHAAYQLAWRQQGEMRPTSIITTFGCPFSCEFCSKPVFGSEVRRRSLTTVIAEIDEIARLGYDALRIADDLFTLNARYVKEFCERMTGRGMSWSCLARADRADAALAAMMKRAGCRRVYLGLESGCQSTLDLMQKRLRVEDAARATRIYGAAGIDVAAFFIVGYPGEDPAAIEQTFALALELPLDEISFNVPMPLPGSALYERLGAPDEGRDWRHENEVTFVYDSEIDERWLRRRIDETLAAFDAARAARRRHPAAAGGAGR